MALSNVIINKTSGNLGRRSPSEDGISGLVCTGIDVIGGLQYDITYELRSINDLEALGVDAAYDETNKLLLHYHVSEFFRLSPSGRLFILVMPQSETLTALCTPSPANPLNKLLISGQGKIRQVGVCINPDGSYPTNTTLGIEQDSLDAIAQAQLTADAEEAEYRPVVVLVEGRNYQGDATNVADARALGNYKNVAIVIAQDKAVANLEPEYAAHAAIGTALGAVSAANVNECIGWVGKFPLTNTAQSKFLVPALSGGQLIQNISLVDLGTLNEKGYIFARTFPNFQGCYFNDSHTCTVASDDFAYIENVRTIDKAARIVRNALLPDVNSPVLVDPDTGKLAPEVIKYFESKGDQAIRRMQQDSEISGYDVYVDPDQDVLSTSLLEVQFELTPTGTARTIKATIGFKNPFNS